VQRTPFNTGWEFRPKVISFVESFGRGTAWESVRLPHDAMLTGLRTPEAGPAAAYFPGGAWEYRTRFVPEDSQRGARIELDFEGVYRGAAVFVNGDLAGRRPYGYSNFSVRLDPLVRFGEENEIRVDAIASEDSRWYSGAGIYRNVWLAQGGPVHVALDGIGVSTPDVDDDGAVIEVTTEVENDGLARVVAAVRVEVLDPTGEVVATATTPLGIDAAGQAVARHRLIVLRPQRWSVERPALHTCRVTVLVDGSVVDGDSTSFGIRTLQLDAARGLRINGAPVKLRGACVHHDNGVLGAATIDRADERRVELLKAAGFNALRSAHQPMARAMLDACDRLGMLVMDEAFDVWTSPKSNDDYARSFDGWWRADVEAMVRKDRNHPSVILYSIGNEIPELGRPVGDALARALTEHVRRLDPTRFVTNAVNPLASIGTDLFAGLFDGSLRLDDDAGVNTLLTGHWKILPAALRQSMVDERTGQAYGPIDVAGYNYCEGRYELDHELHPERVIVGSETFPLITAELWRLVLANPHVIGDFTWTGWDYLGEVGVGRFEYGDGPPGERPFMAEYPWLTAWVGDLDITGHRRPISFYREIVFGLREEPYLAVRRPEHHGQVVTYSSPWAFSDAVPSWSWPAFEGRPVEVEVYAHADEIELLVNGSPAGRAEVNQHRAVLEVTYVPGTVEAVARRGGREVGRAVLRSAEDAVQLGVQVDRAEIRADDHDLAFVTIELTDATGNVHTTLDRPVLVAIDGAGVLQGLGSARPCTEETFRDATATTFDGRALAVVRPTARGPITVTVTAAGCAPASVEVVAR
jgi:beta-galactosidase